MEQKIRLGLAIRNELLTADARRRRSILRHISDAELDHVSVGDHISFHGGHGSDGLVSAVAALASNDDLTVLVGVYLAGLRHPMSTARILANVAQFAPGRLILGVGVGGEDRSEIMNVGVDPSTRGKRMDETLAVLRQFATGDVVNHHGAFFDMTNARILPAQSPPIPIVVGGRGEVAVARAAKYGDGWLGLMCSARRYASTYEQLLAAFSDNGRGQPSFSGLSLWAGLDKDPLRARKDLDLQLTNLYHLPANKFQHVTAAGRPHEVTEFLLPYIDGGARTITLITSSEDIDDAIEMCAEIRRMLLDNSWT